jgi:hypothetical protein
LPNDFALIGSGKMPQKSLGGLLVDECGKATAFWSSPGVQLDHMTTVIDSPLKRCRVPHFTNRRRLKPPVTKESFTGADYSKLRARVFDSQWFERFRTTLSEGLEISGDQRQAPAQSFSEEEIVEIPWHRGIPITRPSVGLS